MHFCVVSILLFGVEFSFPWDIPLGSSFFLNRMNDKSSYTTHKEPTSRREYREKDRKRSRSREGRRSRDRSDSRERKDRRRERSPNHGRRSEREERYSHRDNRDRYRDDRDRYRDDRESEEESEGEREVELVPTHRGALTEEAKEKMRQKRNQRRETIAAKRRHLWQRNSDSLSSHSSHQSMPSQWENAFDDPQRHHKFLRLMGAVKTNKRDAYDPLQPDSPERDETSTATVHSPTSSTTPSTTTSSTVTSEVGDPLAAEMEKFYTQTSQLDRQALELEEQFQSAIDRREAGTRAGLG